MESKLERVEKPVTLLSPSSSSCFSNPNSPIKDAFLHLNTSGSDFFRDVYVNVGRRYFIQNIDCWVDSLNLSSTSAVLLSGRCRRLDCWSVLYQWKFISMLWNFLWQDVKAKTSIFQSSVETCTSSTSYFPFCLDITLNLIEPGCLCLWCF